MYLASNYLFKFNKFLSFETDDKGTFSAVSECEISRTSTFIVPSSLELRKYRKEIASHDGRLNE